MLLVTPLTWYFHTFEMKYRWLLLVLKFRRLLLVLQEMLCGRFITRRIYWGYLLLPEDGFSQIWRVCRLGYITSMIFKGKNFKVKNFQSEKFFSFTSCLKKRTCKNQEILSTYFWPRFPCYIPWKHQRKPKVFWCFQNV